MYYFRDDSYMAYHRSDYGMTTIRSWNDVELHANPWRKWRYRPAPCLCSGDWKAQRGTGSFLIYER
jgi:hypothetical protein